MPILRFEQFAVKKTELGVTPGLSINFMRYNNLARRRRWLKVSACRPTR